ncbi:MAG: GNAT family N-acetyltransferase [Oscillospiraceae bacterium]|nr:GNAT family N-acetyltransferase [Oscillospiraceae bacterium]
MTYYKTITLKDGRECVLRNGTESDGQAAYDNFMLTHEQTDYLLSYPDENSLSPEEESRFLKAKTESKNEMELLAEVDGIIAGLAGIEAVGSKYKVRHRAELGISIDQAFWGLGIGSALMDACIECAGLAGYEQLELNVAAENDRAMSLYRKKGFTEFGRNPRGFKSRISGYQELVYMRLELNRRAPENNQK